MGGNAADWIKECSLYSKASLHLSIKRILCILIYLVYLQHSEEKKKMFGLGSARDLSLSFLPVLFGKTFSASTVILMSSLTCHPSAQHQQPRYTWKAQAGLLRQCPCTPLLCLQVVAVINLLQSGNCCFYLIRVFIILCKFAEASLMAA